MLVNLIADTSVANAPTGFVAAVQTAANVLNAAITNTITVNIRYGWGSYNNAPDGSLIGGTGAEGGTLNGTLASYATLRGWLTASASSVTDFAAINSLPATNASLPSQSLFDVSSAQLKALGHFSGAAGAADGAIGFGTSSTSEFWVPFALHEITHAMGRLDGGGTIDPTILDLFRFNAPGSYQWTAFAPAYLSINGGITDLANYSTTSDASDFKSDNLTTNDPFVAIAGPTTVSHLTPLDLTVMDAIGFSVPPVANAGGVIDGLPINQQLELIYIGYFNRSADGGGFSFWQGQNTKAETPVSSGGFGQSPAVALTNIANAFTPQAETVAVYPFLSATTFDPNSPTAQAQIKSLVDSVYAHLFNHAPDSGGESYWINQILSGAIPLGKAVLAIANGATGSDATILENKITVALDFTTRTAAANLASNATLLAEAKTVLAGVDGVSLNDASVTAAEAVTTLFIAAQPHAVSVALVGVAPLPMHAQLG